MHRLPVFTLRLPFLPIARAWLKPLADGRGFKIRELEEQQHRETLDKSGLEELIEGGVHFDKTLAASMIARQVVAMISDNK